MNMHDIFFLPYNKMEMETNNSNEERNRTRERKNRQTALTNEE